jgi:hypothetical protein
MWSVLAFVAGFILGMLLLSVCAASRDRWREAECAGCRERLAGYLQSHGVEMPL